MQRLEVNGAVRHVYMFRRKRVNEAQHHDSIMKNGDIAYVILTSTMYAGDRSASRHDRFTS
jgi:hypothetical protein